MPEATKPFGNQENPAASVRYERFLVLDGLRGVAAFAVILDHVASTTLRSWFPGRYLAVDFFFVLSGFVLAHAYGARLGQPGLTLGKGADLNPLGFLRIRLIRLYPLYLLAVVIAVIPAVVILLKGWGGNPVPETLLVAAVALLFIPLPPVFGWTNNHLYPLNGPAWSLFFELIANMVYAIIARFLSWRVFAIALPMFAALSAFTVMRHPDVGGPGWLWAHFDAGLARVMFGFFAGVAIYRFRIERGIPAIPAWLGVALLLAIFAVPATGLWRPAFDAFAGIVLMPLLVAFVSGAKISGWPAKLCAALGMLSYGVYVLHVPLLGVTAMSLNILQIEIPYGFLFVILVALVAGIATALAHRVYDAPLRRWLTGVFPAQARATKPHVPAGEAG